MVYTAKVFVIISAIPSMITNIKLKKVDTLRNALKEDAVLFLHDYFACCHVKFSLHYLT